MTYPVLDMIETGKRIKLLRKERGISVRQIQEFMGFDNPQAIYKWQRGESFPSIDNLFALSRLFGTTVDDILCENEALASSFFARFLEYNLQMVMKIWICIGKMCEML